MNYERFISLVNVLDPLTDQCGVKVRRNSFSKMENKIKVAKDRNDSFFGSNRTICLTRKDVFEACNDYNIDKGLLSVLYWGFPTNSHGICQRVHEKFVPIKNIIEYYRNGQLLEDDYIKLMERIQNEVNNTSDEKGLNMGFFSKLFYFYNIHLSCCPCAILDSVVRDTIHNCLQNDEGRFDGLKAAARLYIGMHFKLIGITFKLLLHWLLRRMELNEVIRWNMHFGYKCL